MPITIDTVEFDICGALQTLNSQISGVQAPQPAQYPTAIDTTNGQPFVMTWPGGGEDWQKGAGYSQGTRTFRVIVFLDPVAQSDIPSHAVAGMLLLRKFKNLYIKSTNTPLFNPGPYQATIESGPTGPHIPDGGLVPTLSFGGRPWFGFELPIPVRWQGAQV
jgi:hypothetical protein